jgi:hypothetical protein
LKSSSYFFGMMRTTFPRKKVCIKHGVVQLHGRRASRTHPASTPNSAIFDITTGVTAF